MDNDKFQTTGDSDINHTNPGDQDAQNVRPIETYNGNNIQQSPQANSDTLSDSRTNFEQQGYYPNNAGSPATNQIIPDSPVFQPAQINVPIDPIQPGQQVYSPVNQTEYYNQPTKSKRTKVFVLLGIAIFVISVASVYIGLRYPSKFAGNPPDGSSGSLLSLAADVEMNRQIVEVKGRDTERQTNLRAIHSFLEAFYATKGVEYPVLADLNNVSWRNKNIERYNQSDLCDPSVTDVNSCQLSSKPAKGFLAYQTWESDGVTPCKSKAGGKCPKYTLTATLENTINGSNIYVKNSLN